MFSIRNVAFISVTILFSLDLPLLAQAIPSQETSVPACLYFHVKDCRKEEITYAGQSRHAYAPSYPLVDKAQLHITLEGKNGNILSQIDISNPYFVRSPNPKFRITECRYDIVVPVPQNFNLGSVRKVSFLETGLTSSTSEYAYTGVLSTSTHTTHVDDAESHKNIRPLACALWKSGPPATRINLVILGDGFTRNDMDTSSEEQLRQSRFGQEAQRVMDRLFALEPYRSLKDHFNVWIIGTPSMESGADIPSEETYRHTYFDTSFDRGCMRRAIEVRNKERLLYAASLVPFDQIILLVNSQEYGGNSGLILVASLNQKKGADLVPHEFTHSITRQVAPVVDTYYYFSDLQFVGGSPQCPDRQYGQDIEPILKETTPKIDKNATEIAENQELGKNITLNSDIATVKWRYLLAPNAPVVRFVYPSGTAKLDKSSSRIFFQFIPDQDISRVLLLGGRNQSRNTAIASVSAVTVNGKVFPMRSIRRHLGGAGPRAMTFLELEGLSLQRGQKIEFGLSISDSEALKILEDKLADSGLLTLPSMIFDPDVPGLFQGGHAYVPGKDGLRDVWRSSYRSFMSDPESPFDPVEQEAIRQSVLKFTDKL